MNLELPDFEKSRGGQMRELNMRERGAWCRICEKNGTYWSESPEKDGNDILTCEGCHLRPSQCIC